MSSKFPITIGLQERSVLSPYTYFGRGWAYQAIQDELTWCMMYTVNIVLNNETRAGARI